MHLPISINTKKGEPTTMKLDGLKQKKDRLFKRKYWKNTSSVAFYLAPAWRYAVSIKAKKEGRYAILSKRNLASDDWYDATDKEYKEDFSISVKYGNVDEINKKIEGKIKNESKNV